MITYTILFWGFLIIAIVQYAPKPYSSYPGPYSYIRRLTVFLKGTARVRAEGSGLVWGLGGQVLWVWNFTV